MPQLCIPTTCRLHHTDHTAWRAPHLRHGVRCTAWQHCIVARRTQATGGQARQWHLSVVLPTKRVPNPKPICIRVSRPCLIEFGSILDRSLKGLGLQLEREVNQKNDHMASCWHVVRNFKNSKNRWFSNLLGPSAFQLRNIQKSAPIAINDQSTN